MNSSFPNRWSFSYLKFTKYVTNIIAEPKYKYGQQEQNLYLPVECALSEQDSQVPWTARESSWCTCFLPTGMVALGVGPRIGSYLPDQDQDQDSLLVKRRNDNHSPGPVIRELVPSSHQRSELSNTILCIFSGSDQRIGEGIPIPDSLGEEATFINICIGNGSLKCHRVLIPTTPSFGDKVICWYTGFTFKTFI